MFRTFQLHSHKNAFLSENIMKSEADACSGEADTSLYAIIFFITLDRNDLIYDVMNALFSVAP